MRFPGFEGEWVKCELGKIASISKGAGISKDQLSKEGLPCILYGELYTKYKSEVINEVLSRTDIDATNLVRSETNDVIIPSSGETAIDISTACCIPFNGILLGGDLNIIRLHNGDGRFFSYQLNGKRKYDIAKAAQGVSVVHLYGENLKKLKIFYPSNEEQNKIASLLSLVDDRISTQIKIIEDYKTLQTKLIDYYYSQPYNNNSPIQLAECIFQKSERNKNNEGYPVLSVSNKYGFIRQTEQFENREVASEDVSNYKIVRINDFAYNPARINVGSVAKLTNYDNGIVSPMYVCFHTKDNLLPDFLEFYFNSQLFKNEMKKRLEGSVRQCLTFEGLCDIPMFVPSINEQKSVSTTLLAIQEKINIENNIRNLLAKQKKYILQQMFI